MCGSRERRALKALLVICFVDNWKKNHGFNAKIYVMLNIPNLDFQTVCPEKSIYGILNNVFL